MKTAAMTAHRVVSNVKEKGVVEAKRDLLKTVLSEEKAAQIVDGVRDKADRVIRSSVAERLRDVARQIDSRAGGSGGSGGSGGGGGGGAHRDSAFHETPHPPRGQPYAGHEQWRDHPNKRKS
jgi:hypothetical protein